MTKAHHSIGCGVRRSKREKDYKPYTKPESSRKQGRNDNLKSLNFVRQERIFRLAAVPLPEPFTSRRNYLFGVRQQLYTLMDDCTFSTQLCSSYFFLSIKLKMALDKETLFGIKRLGEVHPILTELLVL